MCAWADRVDPLAGVAGAIQPVRVRRLDLDHSLHGADSQAGGACCDELPEVAARLRNPYEPGLEDGQEDGRREAPVADPHHARPHADRRAIPVPHARLRGLVLPTVSDAKPDRDPVRDERDVEDEQTARSEPEGALGEAFARKWPAHDPRQDVPAEAGGDQRPAADDHQVRVREVPDEVACVAGTREPLGCPGQVLEHHVQAAEDEEGSATDEVLRQLAVVAAELLVRVGRRPDRRRPPGQEPEHGCNRDREERGIAQELQRRDVLEPHGRMAPNGGPAR